MRVFDKLVVARNIVASLILPSPSFKVFVVAPHPFGVIVTFFLGCFMVPSGWFSHPFGQILIKLSLLVRGILTSTATGLVSFPPRFFF